MKTTFLRSPSALGERAREHFTFLATDRLLPRLWLTRAMGWFSKIEQPLIRDLSLATWQHFADLRLEEARKTEFKSVHDCFTRELKPGARAVDGRQDVLVSPCDGIVGGHGQVRHGQLIQAKGQDYSLAELLIAPDLVELYQAGTYVTLRLTPSMYHRFHAPHDCEVEHVTYVAGEAHNTGPVSVARVPKLYCKNERAIVRTRLSGSSHTVCLVPVAAILVASIRLHCLDVLLHLDHPGPNELPCHAHYRKGEEMGWYEHGSTILVFAPPGFTLCEGIMQGQTLRMGSPLMRLPDHA